MENLPEEPRHDELDGVGRVSVSFGPLDGNRIRQTRLVDLVVRIHGKLRQDSDAVWSHMHRQSVFGEPVQILHDARLPASFER